VRTIGKIWKKESKNLIIPMKYITRIGQNTGMSKTSKKVQKNAIVVDFIVDSLKLANKKIIIPVSKSVNI
jgi:hypothetical protein